MVANRSTTPLAMRPGKKRRDECLLRVPYASIVAALLCDVGVALFSVMMAWAFNASVQQFRRALDVDSLPWLDKVSR
ncbi:unnamed protein product [Anisakis simplex]|uniref:Transmembrane protein n=1 Tax=Anisakis simplex TaxID=6269 RepID=A0A0M3JDC4_ANISI|nr:unnamed protein product [Anisakis simplex]